MEHIIQSALAGHLGSVAVAREIRSGKWSGRGVKVGQGELAPERSSILSYGARLTVVPADGSLGPRNTWHGRRNSGLNSMARRSTVHPSSDGVRKTTGVNRQSSHASGEFVAWTCTWVAARVAVKPFWRSTYPKLVGHGLPMIRLTFSQALKLSAVLAWCHRREGDFGERRSPSWKFCSLNTPSSRHDPLPPDETRCRQNTFIME